MNIPIIGLGAICSAGTSPEECFKKVVKGNDALVPLSLFESGLKNTPLVGQLSPAGLAMLPNAPNRTTAMAIYAARQSCEVITKISHNNLHIGLVFATTVGGISRSETFFKKYREDPSCAPQAAVELACHEPTACASHVARAIGATGFYSVSTACSTGLHAVGLAARLIKAGYFDLCCAVGSDALSILTLRGFASLMLIDPNGCKPFDKQRCGISLGEGAGALLLASETIIKQDKLQALGYVCGWGSSTDCHHMTAPHPEGAGAAMAIRQALSEAQIDASSIDLIIAHGTATPDNDPAEIAALKSVFTQVPAFCSCKRTVGHTLAASGALEAVFGIMAMAKSCVPATAGFEQLDEAIGIAPASHHTKPINHVLKNAFGFGGNNAAVIFSKGPS